MEVHLGIDDTDSKKGMCTTYIASSIINRASGKFQPPELVRLNPNIPWKTRGNGALAIRGEVPDLSEFRKKVLQLVEKYREPESDTGVFLTTSDPRKKQEIDKHSKKAVKETVDKENAYEIALKHGDVTSFGDGRGVVGALAAAGHNKKDMTYELLAYRKKENWGEPREIEQNSVLEAAELYPLIWDTVDWKHNQIVITPNSPCPVLYGVRGDHTWGVRKAHEKIESEETSHITIFKTNQGTDEHITTREIKEIEPRTSVETTGTIKKEPKTIEGGHVIFSIKKDGHSIDCAVYEPTKKFRNTIRKLISGDRVTVYGGVKDDPLTINIEKIRLTKKTEKKTLVNPECPECGKNMESAGRNQGYRCRKCKTTHPTKKEVIEERDIEEGYYEVPPIARRHLAKPLIRTEMGYDKQKICKDL